MSHIVRIKPKSNVTKYNGYTITTTFDPETGKWLAIAHKPVTTSIEFARQGKTANFALSLAKRAVDRVNDSNTKAS